MRSLIFAMLLCVVAAYVTQTKAVGLDLRRVFNAAQIIPKLLIQNVERRLLADLRFLPPVLLFTEGGQHHETHRLVILDDHHVTGLFVTPAHFADSVDALVFSAVGHQLVFAAHCSGAVSYTHLTLPTSDL